MYKLLIPFVVVLGLLQSDRSVQWHHNLQLHWDDFNGKPTYGTTVAAVTASGISFGYSSKTSETELVSYTSNVTAQFYPDQSWFVRDRVTSIILDHERLHFDITELHARKFRQRIANTTFTLRINEEMQQIHTAINKELRAMQQKYDNETNHSQNIERQKAWQRTIKLKLEKLAFYSNR